MQSSAKAEHDYTFGRIKFDVSVDGPIDNTDAVVNHMLATATSVESIEAIQFGLTHSQTDEGKNQQVCEVTTKFGEIMVSMKLDFNLKRHTSNRTLNSIVLGAILPKVWQTASIHLGDGKLHTTPPASLMPEPRADILRKIDSLVGTGPSGSSPFYEQPTEQTGTRRQQAQTS